jgi:phospholipase C
MGYFTRQDLAFYYALADAFTVCDGYFCSVLGPTDPNRLMLMSATIDPAGSAGGPVVQTFTDRLAEYGKLHWETMPERLAPNTAVPALPAASLGDTSVAEQAVLNALAGTLDVGIPYPLPKSNSMPAQEATPSRPPVPS